MDKIANYIQILDEHPLWNKEAAVAEYYQGPSRKVKSDYARVSASKKLGKKLTPGASFKMRATDYRGSFGKKGIPLRPKPGALPKRLLAKILSKGRV